jgi:serine/threonine protein kinase
MWQKVGASSKNPVDTLNLLTTQVPQDRPPYYDHGIMGALMLGSWWREIEQFAINLARPSPAIDRIVATKKRDSAAYEIMSVHGLVICAIESIGFHNVALRQWPEQELVRLWDGSSGYMAPGLDNNAHMFFLALCDTLQDWDRHHYVPAKDRLYRPAVPASRMLVQANGDHIAISLPGGGEIPTVRKLFHGWLAENDTNSLFRAGAQFSLPDIVYSGTPDVTVSEISDSDNTRNRLQRQISRAVQEARLVLINDISDAIVRAGPIIEDCIGEVHRLQSRILPKQRMEFDQSSEWRQLLALQSMTASSLSIGSRVTRGTVQYPLGDGGFGIVYAVESADATSEGASVAYKVYHAADLTNQSKRELFKRGFHAMRKLSASPHVVDVYEYTELPVGFYMKLINGKDLQAGLADIPVVHDRLLVLETICRTLVYAHDHEVLHRDVKPANVILDRDDNGLKPVLTDFDLAWISGRSTITSAAYVSMRYGAPEQFEDRLAPHRSRPTVDVFSFGALTYFVMTGEEPPPMATFKEDHWRIARERLVGKLHGSSIDDLIGLIRDCTMNNPANRPQSMHAVLSRLASIRSETFSEESTIPHEDFLREIIMEYSGGTGTSEVFSRTGACRWGLEVYNKSQGAISIRLAVELMRDASYEGVSHDEYKRRVARRIDETLRRVKGTNAGKAWVKDIARRGGLSSRMWMIDVVKVTTNRQNAVRLANMMSSITGVVE